VSTTIYRPLTSADEYPLFSTYPAPASGVGARSRTFDEYVAEGDYRPERVWIAERDGAVIARAAFWAPEDSPVPWGVDYFDPGTGPDRVEVGAALLRAAYAALVPPDYSAPPHPEAGRPDYHLFLPSDWAERPDARADAADRIAAAESAGLTRFVERLNLRWTAADGLPPRSTRLRFEPAADGVSRAWWRLAYTPAGDIAGFVLPALAPSPTIWYIGVVPEHRGHHYSDDLVTEALHIFTAAGETQANDNTDVGNAPMAASFARCGYRVVGRRIVFV
jgi:ribosomal protein S18 acetylase RimI-like enzyme